MGSFSDRQPGGKHELGSEEKHQEKAVIATVVRQIPITDDLVS